MFFPASDLTTTLHFAALFEFKNNNFLAIHGINAFQNNNFLALRF